MKICFRKPLRPFAGARAGCWLAALLLFPAVARLAAEAPKYYLDTNPAKAIEQIRSAVARRDFQRVLYFCEEAEERRIGVPNLEFFRDRARQQIENNHETYDPRTIRAELEAELKPAPPEPVRPAPLAVPLQSETPDAAPEREAAPDASPAEAPGEPAEITEAAAEPEPPQAEPLAQPAAPAAPAAPPERGEELAAPAETLVDAPEEYNTGAAPAVTRPAPARQYKFLIAAAVAGAVLLGGGLLVLIRGRRKSAAPAPEDFETAAAEEFAPTERTLPVRRESTAPVHQPAREKTVPFPARTINEERTILMMNADAPPMEEHLIETTRQPALFFNTENEEEQRDQIALPAVPAAPTDDEEESIVLDEDESRDPFFALSFEDKRPGESSTAPLVVGKSKPERKKPADEDEAIDISFDAMEAKTGAPFKLAPSEQPLPESGISSLHEEKTIIEFASNADEVEADASRMTLAEKRQSGRTTHFFSSSKSAPAAPGGPSVFDGDETIVNFQARQRGDSSNIKYQTPIGEKTVFNPSARADAAFQAEYAKGLRAFEQGNYKDAVHFFNIAIALDSGNEEVKEKLRLARSRHRD